MFEDKMYTFYRNGEFAFNVTGTSMKWFKEYSQMIVYDGEEIDRNIVAAVPMDWAVEITLLDIDEECKDDEE